MLNPLKKLEKSDKTFPQFCSLLLIMGLFCFSFSCSHSADEAGETIESPPDIPIPPRKITSKRTFPSEKLGLTAVIEKTPISMEIMIDNPALKRALTLAMQRGVIASNASAEEMGLENPVTRGEFALWLAGFRGLEPKGSAFPSYSDVPKSHPQFEAIEAVSSAGLIQGVKRGGNMLFNPSERLTRETFCALYVAMIKANRDSYKLDDFEQMKPVNVKGSKQNFEHFTDYSAITPTYRHDVALAYRDKVLSKAFNLTPAQLTSSVAFRPHKPMTRMEALLFLAK